jgi:hypothetical protein
MRKYSKKNLKVQRRTVRTYLAENKQRKSQPQRKTVFSPQQEKELSKRISSNWVPHNLKDIRNACVRILCEKQYSNPFVKEKGMAACAWLEGFCVVIQ